MVGEFVEAEGGKQKTPTCFMLRYEAFLYRSRLNHVSPPNPKINLSDTSELIQTMCGKISEIYKIFEKVT